MFLKAIAIEGYALTAHVINDCLFVLLNNVGMYVKDFDVTGNADQKVCCKIESIIMILFTHYSIIVM